METKLIRIGVVLLCLLASATGIARADRPNYADRGSYAVKVVDETWHDSARNRDIPVRIYAPEQPPDGGGVILFSHGLGGSTISGEEWGRQWASWGFVSVHLQHYGSDSQIWKATAGHTVLQNVHDAMTTDQLLARVADVKFAVGEVARRKQAGDPVFVHCDPTVIGLAGHSFGAQTTQAVAGQVFPAPYGSAAADPRIRAFIAFSPSARPGLDYDTQFGGISAPFLSITGSQDQLGITPDITPQTREVPFQHMTGDNKYLLWLDTASHLAFDGRPLPSLGKIAGYFAGVGAGPVNMDHIFHVTDGVTTAYWIAYLGPDASARATALSWLKDGAGGVHTLLTTKDEFHVKTP